MSYQSESFSTGLVYNGLEIIETLYKSKQPRTKEQMLAKIKRIQAAALKANVDWDFEVAILTDAGWRSDKVFTANDEPAIFDPVNYHYEDAYEFNCDYQTFVIYCMPKAPSVGNTSDNKKNDCLFIAIKNILEGKMPEGFRKPRDFKERLGVERCDGVDISKMGMLEDLMKINVNVVGDHIFTSSNKYNKNINLSLIKGHYSFNTKTQVHNTICNKKPIIFYRQSKDTIELISEKNGNWSEEFVRFDVLKEKYSDYFLINSNIEKSKNKSLSEDFKEFVAARDELMEASNGFIDLYEKPMMKSAAMHVFHHQARHLPTPEEISPLEASWINNSFVGGLMYSKQNTQYDKAICIDQNSQYAANLSSKNFMIPIKAGKFTTLASDTFLESGFASYGIYRCVITNEQQSKTMNRLFRFNSLHYYTHYDISNALKLKFKIELIQDGQANALLYDATARVKGDHTFGKTVSYLFELKSKVKFTKRIISALWGGLCEKNKYTVHASKTSTKTIPENSKVLKLHKTMNGISASYRKNDNIYKSNFARVGPFLTSYCRTKIAETILKNFDVENIVRIHTDGFIVINQQIPQDLLSSELGKFKVEHEGQCIVHNTNKIDWIK